MKQAAILKIHNKYKMFSNSMKPFFICAYDELHVENIRFLKAANK